MLNALSLALSRPTYAQGLLDVGRNATAQARANIYNDSQQRVNSGLFGAYNLGINPGNSNPEAALAAMSQATGLPPEQAMEAYQAGQQQAAVNQKKSQQEALVKYLDGKGNKEVAALAAMGIVTPGNVREWMQGNAPVKLGEGAILVNGATGAVIASNPRTGGQAGNNYSLTGAEVETYESIISTDKEVEKALDTNGESQWWNPTTWGGSDDDVNRIVIDRAEQIRSTNPQLTKQQALRLSAGIAPVSGWTYMTDPVSGESAWVSPDQSQFIQVK